MFHVSPSINRASIRAHGLDISLMRGVGIAGSRIPELEAVHLVDTLAGAHWYASFETHDRVDVWEIDATDLSLQEIEGGWVSFDAISPDRLTLRNAGLTTEEVRADLDAASPERAPCGELSVELRQDDE